jgi:para-nitrobenzyl esterase
MSARLSLIAGLAVACASIVGCDRSTSPPATTTPPPTAPAATQPAASVTHVASDLAGTAWQLVKFSGSDGSTREPDDRSKYTLAFQPDGSVAARIDCNRGRGTWKSTEPNQLQFGPLAMTRMMCPPESMDSRVVADWEAVRSYTIKDGHLFLSLMADSGIYEYEPAGPPAPE